MVKILEKMYSSLHAKIVQDVIIYNRSTCLRYCPPNSFIAEHIETYK